MTMLATAEGFEGQPVPCPGPIPTVEARAERCRACGRCGAIARIFDEFMDDDREALPASRPRAIE